MSSTATTTRVTRTASSSTCARRTRRTRWEWRKGSKPASAGTARTSASSTKTRWACPITDRRGNTGAFFLVIFGYFWLFGYFYFVWAIGMTSCFFLTGRIIQTRLVTGGTSRRSGVGSLTWRVGRLCRPRACAPSRAISRALTPITSGFRTGIVTRPGYQKGTEPVNRMDIPSFDKVMKHDLATGKVWTHDLGEGRACGDIVFVPDPESTSEDDGHLLVMVHVWKRNGPNYWRWDGTKKPAGFK